MSSLHSHVTRQGKIEEIRWCVFMKVRTAIAYQITAMYTIIKPAMYTLCTQYQVATCNNRDVL